jgi:hypothetical protein
MSSISPFCFVMGLNPVVSPSTISLSLKKLCLYVLID